MQLKIIFSELCEYIVLLKVKVWANFKVFSCPICFQLQMQMNEKGQI